VFQREDNTQEARETEIMKSHRNVQRLNIALRKQLNAQYFDSDSKVTRFFTSRVPLGYIIDSMGTASDSSGMKTQDKSFRNAALT
jgi:hypothetical protein